MDKSDFQDMLFGIAGTQDVPDEALFEDSDEDILFPDGEDEPILWDLPNDQLLTPPTSSPQPEELTNTDTRRYNHIGSRQQHTDYNRRPVRDRYCYRLWTWLTIAKLSADTG
jgi:hypothetical protein